MSCQLLCNAFLFLIANLEQFNGAVKINFKPMRILLFSPTVRIVGFIVLMFHVPVVFGQADVKFEVEKSVDVSEFPVQSVDLLQPVLNQSNRTRYYLEVSSSDTTYELKTRYCNSWHSVEFDQEGNLLDVEQDVKFASIETDTREKINEWLTKTFERHKIKKVQIQYTVKYCQVADAINSFAKADYGCFVVRYEIVVAVKNKDGGYNLMEVLFATDGAVLLQRKIIEKNDDHVLY